MLAIPLSLQSKFEAYLRNKTISGNLQWQYKKWLRYYLDYCMKYQCSPLDKSSLPRYISKLHEKKQTAQQQEQAAEAIKLYYEVISKDDQPRKAPLPQSVNHREQVSFTDRKQVCSHESPGIAIKQENVIPAPSRGAGPSAGRHSSSKTVSVS